MQSQAQDFKSEYNSIDETFNILDDINKSNEALIQELNEIKDKKDEFIFNFREYKKYKKKFICSILALISAYSISTAVLIKTNYSYYNVTQYEYSEENGITKEDKRVKLEEYEGNKIYIKDYKKIDDSTIEVITYDASDIKLDNIEEYMKCDTEELDYTKAYEKLTSDSDLNSEEIRKIINLVSDNEVHKHHGNTTLINILIYILFLDLFEIRSKITMLGKNTTKFKLLAKNNAMYLSVPLSKIILGIYKNDKLRNKFVELFNQNKYLLNDPDILIQKYNEIIQKLDTISLKNEIEELNLNIKKLKG